VHDPRPGCGRRTARDGETIAADWRLVLQDLLRWSRWIEDLWRSRAKLRSIEALQ
jgi:hypothetical protein